MSNRRQAIIWTNADPIRWRIYAALRGHESTPKVPRDFAGYHRNIFKMSWSVKIYFPKFISYISKRPGLVQIMAPNNDYCLVYWGIFVSLGLDELTTTRDKVPGRHVYKHISVLWVLNTRQNRPYFADDTFKCIFFNENLLSLQFRLKFHLSKSQLTIVQHWFR